MKLFLMRHANAEINNIGIDLDRNLTDVGVQEAKKASLYVKDQQIDKLIISFAKRTIQTANILQEQIHISNEQIVRTLYEGNIESIKNLIAVQDEKNILIVGHNPLIYNLALEFISSKSKSYDELLSSGMPSARIIKLEFSNLDKWSEIHTNTTDKVDIFTA